VAGSPYAIAASNAVGTGLANYNISYVNGGLTVNAKALTITANSASKTYGQTVTFAGTEFTAGGLVNGDSVSSVTLTSSGAAATASVAGSPYAIVASAATGSGLANYNISYVNGSLTVNAKALTITANSTSKTYGQTVTFAGTEFSTAGLVNGDTVSSVTLVSSGAAATAAVGGSPYAIVASSAVGSGLSNYAISYVNGALTVNAKALTVTANSTSKTYGQTVTFAGTEFSTSGLVNGDTVSSVTLVSSGANAAASVAGSPYAIVASAAVGSGLGNYSISYVNGSLTVNAATLTITAKDASKTFGQSLTFSGSEFTATGLQNGETVGSVTLVSGGSDATASVGPYDIVASAATGGTFNASNYNIGYVDGTLTVNARALTVTANSTSKTYGQTVTFAGTEFSTSGLVNGDTVSSVTLVSSGAAVTAAVAGSPYAIVASAATGSGLANYNISYVNGTLTVNAKALTITANSTSKTYGQTVTFAGTEFSAAGLVNGDSVSSVTLTSSGAAATASVAGSPYAITASAAVGSGLSNYNISYVNGTLTVNTKALTITAKDISKTYGQTITFAGTELTAAGLANGDSVSSVSLSSAGAAATASVAGSPYAITASAAVGSGLANYAISYVNGTLTVNTKALTITAKDISKTYGQTITFAGTELTAAGLANGDTVSSVSLSSSGAAATAAVAGSPYAITASNAVGTGLANYNISYANGSLTVAAATLTITAKDASKTFGQSLTFSGSEFTATGLQNGETVGSVTLSSNGADAAAVGGTYAITPSAATGGTFTAGNYAVSYVDGTLTVNQAAAITSNNSATFTVGSNSSFTITTTGFPTPTFSENGALPGGVGFTDNGNGTATLSGSPLTSGTFTFTITAQNGVGTLDSQTFTLTANPSTTPPTDVSLSGSGSVLGLPGQTVGTLNTADPNLNQSFTYSLVGGDSSLFALNGNTLVTSAAFPASGQASYTVVVRSTDSLGLSVDKALTVTVSNFPPTDIGLSSTTVTGLTGVAVGTLSAQDADAGETFTFSLVPGTRSDDNALFAVSGNTLMASAGFPAAQGATYSVRVRVTDSGPGSLSFEKVFTLTAQFSPPTDINLSNDALTSGGPAGTPVGALTTLDPNVSATFTYALTGRNADLFAIDPASNTLLTAASLQVTAPTTFVVDVTVTDSLGLSFTKALSVTVSPATQTATTPSSTGSSQVAASLLVDSPATTTGTAGPATTTTNNNLLQPSSNAALAIALVNGGATGATTAAPGTNISSTPPLSPTQISGGGGNNGVVSGGGDDLQPLTGETGALPFDLVRPSPLASVAPLSVDAVAGRAAAAAPSSDLPAARATDLTDEIFASHAAATAPADVAVTDDAADAGGEDD
jgi:hypothetical protein